MGQSLRPGLGQAPGSELDPLSPTLLAYGELSLP
jgi:hypothetical protein